VAAAIGDAARDDSDRDHNQRSRRDRETGLEKRVAHLWVRKKTKLKNMAVKAIANTNAAKFARRYV
jgi:hypothetical protein